MARRLVSIIKNLVRIAKLLSTDDSGDLRFCTVASLGKDQKALLFTPYGLMHHPPGSSLAIILNQQAQESNSLAMADDPKSRPLKNLKEGEVALGNYLTGDYIYFDELGNLHVNTSNDLIATVGRNANITAVNDIVATAGNNANIVATTQISLTAPVVAIQTGAFGVSAIGGGPTSSAFDGGAAFTGGSVTHNGTNIGDTHQHSGVSSGTSNTGPPV